MNFRDAEFKKDIEFKFTEFSKIAYFRKATFYGKADFQYTIFSEVASFTETKSFDEINFARASFSEHYHTYFCSLNRKREFAEFTRTPRLLFQNTIFPEKVLFSDCDLSKTSFEECSVEKIKFVGCNFAKEGFGFFKRNAFQPKIYRTKNIFKNFILAFKAEGQLLKKVFFKKNYFALIKKIKKQKTKKNQLEVSANKIKKTIIIKDEQKTKELAKISQKVIKINEKLQGIGLETEKKRKDREDFYRKIKTIQGVEKNWKLMGDFYIGEMEAKRSKNFWNYIGFSAYKYFLGYSERISIIICWIFLIWLAAAFWFVFFENNYCCDFYCFFKILFKDAMEVTFLPLSFRLEFSNNDPITTAQRIFLILSWFFWVPLIVAIQRRFRF